MRTLSTVFKALSDPSRTRIVNLLLYGESCVCELQGILRESQPKISRHLAYLKNSGLIRDRRDGTRMFYSLEPRLRQSQKVLLIALRKSFVASPLLAGDLIRLKCKLAKGEMYFIQGTRLPELKRKRRKKLSKARK
ncbi:MAG: hypothetical protein A2Z27_02065 [candidate division Zixibacteria bacterium RBG_16_50_21]|nr:MAG: hypothetical protein A2Z27_02065 [candidate division Zixibacteria bacterium RBG_16_50_21]